MIRYFYYFFLFVFLCDRLEIFYTVTIYSNFPLPHFFFLVTHLRKQVSDGEEIVNERTREANHLLELVEKMEASGNQSDMIKVQLQDLKTELATAEGMQQESKL